LSLSSGGDNGYFVDLYARYKRDPNSVPADLAIHFQEIDGDVAEAKSSSGEHLVANLIDSYRRFGHLEAQIDPLSPNNFRNARLELLRAEVQSTIGPSLTLTIGGSSRSATVVETDSLLRSVYAASTGIEADYINSDEERNWLYEAFESTFLSEPDNDLLFNSLESIVLADEFETAIRMKFPTKKRFGSEGSESSIVFVRELLRFLPETNTKRAVMGGMHRGRLALLAAALKKNPATLIAEIIGRDLTGDTSFTGDVPYHLGYATDVTVGKHPINVTLLPHPSHLLVVAPVALGLARAVSKRDDAIVEDTACILLHTDAAFSGQGVAAELLQIGGLEGYSCGGSIHLVVNNQIGFTTLPSEGRTARYCTDFAKAVEAPVLHVNADDPVAVARVAQLAVAWRDRFRKDIVVDLVCYRRFGHNELDEPRFTQPEMWKKIDDHPPVRKIFTSKLEKHKPEIIVRAEAAGQEFQNQMRIGFELAADLNPNEQPFQSDAWLRLPEATENELNEDVLTGIERDRLREIGISTSLISDMSVNAKVEKFYSARSESITDGEGINFATAEALAFATLLSEGSNVRLSGQDAVRGTFTQRHLAIHDKENGGIRFPLSVSTSENSRLELINSPLSEYGVLSFEYGHSLFDPNQLTIWEAQFGDFLNGAQVVVDQYIVSAESKWRLRSGLVMMLPHGLEGQGPDHSSARIERLTQLCANGNIIVAQPSTPANLFHLLRRQVRAPWRKPLFIISPKSLLRAKAAASPLSAMAEGTTFLPVMSPLCESPLDVRRVVFSSGKVSYDLEREREAAGLQKQIQPIRIEQIYPLARKRILEIVAAFKNAEFVWLQEEPENQGAWPYLRDELAKSGVKWSEKIPVVARPSMPVSAGGSIERHEREHHILMDRVLDLGHSRAGNAKAR
jgi:2-oxoglutarate dehydrogenase E1 component